MKFFELAISNFESVGISPNKSRLNGKLLMAFTCYWLVTASNVMFLVREVKSFNEIANSIFVTSGTTAISTCFTLLIIINKNKSILFANNANKMSDRGKKIKHINHFLNSYTND